ncbi:DUF4158 domain-containing protein [Glutamicibacter creatinolyticus]
MPVEFLSDNQVAVYGQFSGPVSPAELERFFFLNDRDVELVGRRRREGSRLGTSGWDSAVLGGVSVGSVGCSVVEYLATQL